jgi:GR25 family glycosyltransferase involved in LPS biosynthesis
MLISVICTVSLLFWRQLYSKSIYKAFIVNLPKRTERLKSITQQLNEYEIPYEIQTAISPDDIVSEAHARRTNSPPTGLFHQDTKLNFTIGKFKGMRRTELGCYQSHVQIMIKIAKSKTNDPVLVVEDDALLLPDFYNKTIILMKKLPIDWELFHVGYCPEATCAKRGPKTSEFCRKTHSRLWCTHAYFINGSKVAEHALNVLNTPVPIGILDAIFYKITENYYVSIPKLAKQIYKFKNDNGH